MHLFVIDLYISIDTFAPIADHLSERKKKVLFFNSNVIQNHSSKNNLLLKYLKKNENFKMLNNYKIYNFKFIFVNFLIYIFKFFLNLTKKKAICFGGICGSKIFIYRIII